MKKNVVLLCLMMVALAVSYAFGQRETPAGAGDKNLAEGDGIKMRSVEMERMKQEARRTEAAAFAPINKDISARFPQIKEDFEGIQISEAAIITAFTTGKTIDYSLIASSADEINKKAKRLDSNLFAVSAEKKAGHTSDEGGKEKIEKPKSVRDLIIELDKAIGSFVSSKIFGNIKVIDFEVAINTRTDLLNILKLSEKLSLEAKDLK
jgi:hypothetical protein